MAERERNREQLDEQAARASELILKRAASRAESDGAQDAPQQAYPRSLGRFVRQNIVYIAGVVAVAVVAAVLLVFLGRVMSHSPDGGFSEQDAGYESPYDWTKLDRSDSRYAYVDDGAVKSRAGIDVSENQHAIDWDSVAGDGIDFAMIRLGYRGATEGNLYLDGQYRANFDGARAAGLDCGIYFFSQARTVDEAVEEADFVIERLAGAFLEYPIAFDSEKVALGLERSRTTGLSNDEMSAIAEAFCERIEGAGYHSMVYGNAADLSRYSRAVVERYPVWWAEYGMPVPSARIDFALWQYSNAGQVAGVSTAVDLNIDLSRALD